MFIINNSPQNNTQVSVCIVCVILQSVTIWQSAKSYTMSSYRSAKNLCTRANRINAIIYVIILSKRLILNIFSSKPIINEYKTANIPQAALGCICIFNI